jgi:hypothetical protein
MGWNVTVSDFGQVHVATGLALSTAFALALHYPHKYGLKPLLGYARENLHGFNTSNENTPPPVTQELL